MRLPFSGPAISAVMAETGNFASPLHNGFAEIRFRRAAYNDCADHERRLFTFC